MIIITAPLEPHLVKRLKCPTLVTGITFGEASILKISTELYGTLFVFRKLNRRQI